MFHKLTIIELEITLFALFEKDKAGPVLHVTETWRGERSQGNQLSLPF